MSKLKEKLCDYCGEPIPLSYEEDDGFCSKECREQDAEDNEVDDGKEGGNARF